jgi:hypothetical protein
MAHFWVFRLWQRHHQSAEAEAKILLENQIERVKNF